MDVLVILDGFGSKKQSQTKPNLFSPQILWGLKNQFEKTKPICGKAKWR